MNKIYIGIGSNLGQRQDNCEKAINLMNERGITVTRRSSMIETEPWGITNQPDFINMAVEAETSLGPEELLAVLKKIETETGRTPIERWGPRVVDLDILFYNDHVIRSEGLEIPHPGIRDREFVLKPLMEIAPDKVHPVLKKSVKDLFLQYSQNS